MGLPFCSALVQKITQKLRLDNCRVQLSLHDPVKHPVMLGSHRFSADIRLIYEE
jgi:hypothetical protein